MIRLNFTLENSQKKLEDYFMSFENVKNVAFCGVEC